MDSKTPMNKEEKKDKKEKPTSRRERRHKKKVNTRSKELTQVYLRNLSNEYKNIINMILEGYCSRLNTYLSTCTSEFIEKIGYEHIMISFGELWEKPSQKVIDQMLKVRKHVLKPDEDVYYTRATRTHLLKGKVVESFEIHANLGYRTKEAPTKSETEVINKSTFLGTFAEKGIEYHEAERQQKIDILAKNLVTEEIND